jgi:acyl carrier protein
MDHIQRGRYLLFRPGTRSNPEHAATLANAISGEAPYQLRRPSSIKKAVSDQADSAMSSIESMICAATPTFVMKRLTDHTTPSSGAQELALAQLIVETLNLDVAAATIDAHAPLFGEGLGLDSIDMLEIALAVSQTYGVKLRADDTDNEQIFRSLASLNLYIQQHRV